MKYLFDTCVISELVSKQPSVRVVEWVDSLDPDDVYLSVLTICGFRGCRTVIPGHAAQ